MRIFLNGIQILLIWLWTLLSASIGFILLPFLGQKRSIYLSSKIWSGFILWVAGVKIEVEGKNNLRLNSNLIYTANHESSFDIPILFWVMPVPLFFLAKAELKKIPVFGWFVSAVGMVFIDRKDHNSAMNSLVKAGDEIKKGKNIISFPEGTRTRDGKLKMFKRGSFILALENNIDVVPVGISGSFEINPPGYKIRPGKVLVRIGKPVKCEDFSKSSPDTMAKYTEEEVKNLLIPRN